MSWTHIASSSLNENTLDLYAAPDRSYMIRLNGLELMNSRCHSSENMLGELAGLLARGTKPKVLLGGLGLGYTLASLVETLGEGADITVAEISSSVIEWFKDYFCRNFRPIFKDVSILNSDVISLLGTGETYDLVALDIDNGPLPFSTAGNAFLYSVEGLRAIWSSLSNSGLYLVWSGFESPEFNEAARLVGFSVARVPVQVTERRDFLHHIYVLSKRPFDKEELGHFGIRAACYDNYTQDYEDDLEHCRIEWNR